MSIQPYGVLAQRAALLFMIAYLGRMHTKCVEALQRFLRWRGFDTHAIFREAN